jgi:acyl-coenzyme A thioesterase PaaI-like protein
MAAEVKRELTEEQRREVLRIVSELRRCIDAAVTLRAPLEELTSMADQARALADALHARWEGRPVPRYGPGLDGDDPNAMIAFSPVTGRYSPLSPPIEIALATGPDGKPRVVGRVTFGEAYEGPPDSVHGGIVASSYDQMLAFACMANGAGGPTATLTVRFRKLTPLRVPVRFEAWVDRIEGRKVFARGTCLTADGELVSDCEGMFVRFQR